jgi:hypothetical protein
MRLFLPLLLLLVGLVAEAREELIVPAEYMRAHPFPDLGEFATPTEFWTPSPEVIAEAERKLAKFLANRRLDKFPDGATHAQLERMEASLKTGRRQYIGLETRGLFIMVIPEGIEAPGWPGTPIPPFEGPVGSWSLAFGAGAADGEYRGTAADGSAFRAADPPFHQVYFREHTFPLVGQAGKRRGVLLPADFAKAENAFYTSPEIVYWTPDEAVAREAEARLAAFLDAEIGKSSEEYPRHKVERVRAGIDAGFRKYCGYMKDGRRMLFIEREPEMLHVLGERVYDGRQEVENVSDGGAAYWRISYDVEKGEFFGLIINGLG